MSFWRKKIPRLLGRVAYAGGLVAVFVLASYLAFSLFVRSGVTPVPAVVGLSEEEAAALLADQGLRLGLAPGSEAYDAEIPAGHVVRQEPAPRTLVKRGGEVRAVLSLGPRVLEVPDLVGQSLQAARLALAAGDLEPGRTLHVFSDGAAPGTVVEHSPAAGALVAPRTTVDLLVARESAAGAYLMPDLVYRRREEVERFFRQRGFRLGSVKFETYEGIAEGVILRQFPLAGHPLQPWDAISLVVSVDKEGPPA